MKPNQWILGIAMMISIFACAQEKSPPSDSEKNPKTSAQTNSFGIPDTPLTAQQGDFVLAPPERLVKESRREKKYLPFTLHQLAKVGPQESKVIKGNQEELVPNALIIPLGSSQGAQLGDIVLTANPLQKNLLARGIVTEEENAGDPRVHYLEIRELSRLDNRKFPLKPGTFRVLDSPGEVGSELLCKRRDKYTGVTLIHSSSDNYLTKNPLGRMAVYSKSDCEPIPLKPQVQKGDTVWVPIGNFYREGTVKKVEANLGRLYVEYSFGKLLKERTFPFGVVALSLPHTAAKNPTQVKSP